MPADPQRPGPRDHLMTTRLREQLASLPAGRVLEEALDPEEAPLRLGRHLVAALTPLLKNEGLSGEQAALVNQLLLTFPTGTESALGMPPTVLTEILETSGAAPARRPATPFATSDLLVNGPGQPNMGAELKAEIASADSIDLICAFVIWSGVVAVREPLRALIERGGTVRVITTTYMGATQRRAVDELVALGADVRIAFDARTTKLHAKAWLMERASGLTTAFIGSSNLSQTALFDGLEWNVRLSEVDAPHIIERVRAMFDTHWESGNFEAYDPAARGEDLDKALGAQKDAKSAISFVGLDVHPYPYQREMLERLQLQRERHDRHRNLVVAATGTGKTVLAALDYRGLCGKERPSLLFVAHRGEILDQSIGTFRQVLHDGSFGEKHGAGVAASGQHVFAMIQSLSPEWFAANAPEEFDVVIVDEFHHAKAASYAQLLEHVTPVELVGLTATPERLDGQDVTEWFGGRIAVELRLWQAIDEQHLVPFQYFGVADGTDLKGLKWSGGYVQSELSNLYTADHARVGKLLKAMERVIADPHEMRALGFCVTVEHAKFMAERFNAAGLPARSVDGSMSVTERREALELLRRGELRAVFSVDVLGEGVDVPVVDTILLLRPTQSATVFTQQIGRGLRRSPGKTHLTIIDLVGQQHRAFRFDQRLAAIVDTRQGSVLKQVEQGFAFLPSGCNVELDAVSREIVLENLRAIAKLGSWSTLVGDLKGLGSHVSLAEYLRETEREPADLYRAADASWTRLRRSAGLATPDSNQAEDEPALLRAVSRSLHIDDPERVAFYGKLLALPAPPPVAALSVRERRLIWMLTLSMWGAKRTFPDLDAALRELWKHPAVLAELVELLAVLDERSATLPAVSTVDLSVPLAVHGAYTTNEIVAAYGYGTPSKPPQVREGVKWMKEANTDVFFVTLHKADRDYSPTTMYRDFAISPTVFHWESQATQSQGSESVKRYASGTSTVHLFLRDRKTDAGRTMPYVFAGPLHYVSHKGDRPVSFTWRLEAAMPEALYEVARSVAA